MPPRAARWGTTSNNNPSDLQACTQPSPLLPSGVENAENTLPGEKTPSKRSKKTCRIRRSSTINRNVTPLGADYFTACVGKGHAKAPHSLPHKHKPTQPLPTTTHRGRTRTLLHPSLHTGQTLFRASDQVTTGAFSSSLVFLRREKRPTGQQALAHAHTAAR